MIRQSIAELRAAVAFVLAFVAVSLCGRVAEAAQVSDEFIRVAKAVTKAVAVQKLKDVGCTGRDPDAKEVCDAVVDSAATAVSIAIDGKLDDERLTKTLVDLSLKLTQAATAHAAKDVLAPVLEDVARDLRSVSPSCNLNASSLASDMSGCLVQKTLGTKPARRCDNLAKALASSARSCGLTMGADTKPTVAAAVDALHEAAMVALRSATAQATLKRGYQSLLALHVLAQVLEAGDVDGFYAVVSRVASHHDKMFAGLDSPNDQSIFSEAKLAEVAKPPGAQCANAAAVQARVEQWRRESEHVFVTLLRHLAKGQDLPKVELDKIPTDLPDPKCSSSSDPFAVNVQKLRRYAVTYRVDVTVTSQIDRLVYPALMTALLLDYVRDQNERRLRENFEDFARRAAARALAAADRSPVRCNLPDKLAEIDNGKCRVLRANGDPEDAEKKALEKLPKALLDVLAPTITEERDKLDALAELLQRVVEERASPAAARRTCAYQAIASALGQSVEIDGAGLCRKTSAGRILQSAPLTTLTADHAAAPPLLAQWKPGLVKLIGQGRASIEVASDLSRDFAWNNTVPILEVAENQMKADAIASWVSPAKESLSRLLERRTSESSRVLLSAAGRQLEPMVEAFLDRHLISSACAQGNDSGDLRCGVRVLIGAIYGPIMAYVQIENPTEADRRRLASEAYRKVLELDPLSRTPVLLNVGLGVTALSRFDDTSYHLTLLDKIGVAARWGDRNQWEVGAFAGGFLDAIVREAADAEDHDAYWLVGATFGRRQIFTGVPLGAGLHVAGALPFNLEKIQDTAALAGGLTLTVPVDVAIEE